MKRSNTDQLRKQLDQLGGRRGEHATTSLTMLIADTLLNMLETLEDIAASLDRQRLAEA